jgi:predicted DNA-binding transcriptional regulator YafY
MPHIKNALIRFRIIDRCLRNKYDPFPTKQDLREKCEEALFGFSEGANICDSTIEKDMFAMKMEHDAPIKYSKRHGGYYYADPEFSINDIPLTDDDLNSIQFAVNTLMQFRDVALFKQFGSAIDKIFDRVAIAKDQQEEDISHIIQFESAVSSGGNEFLPLLFDAIRSSNFVRFDYASFVSGKSKSRNVLPLLLKEYRNRWYVITFDESKQDIVTYALDRIKNLEAEERVGLKPENFDPVSYFRYAVGISSNHSNPERVVFKADNVAAKYILSQPFHPNQKVLKEGKNKTTFELSVLISEELIRTIMSFGGEIEVLEPLSLRNLIVARVQQLMEAYRL